MLDRRALVAAAAAVVMGFAGSAQAVQFAGYLPVDPPVGHPTAPNIFLKGTTLSSSSPVEFEYTFPGKLAALGDLPAIFTLNAVETAAASLGPLALATFDGSFSFNYSGPNTTIAGITLTTGETLLDGQFASSVYTGYGTASSLVDSIVGGGLVNFNDNSLVSFQPPGGDESMSISVVNMNNPARIAHGMLKPFNGVSSGVFAADNAVFTGGGTPEPATWALMLLGVGGIGAVARKRAKAAVA